MDCHVQGCLLDRFSSFLEIFDKCVNKEAECSSFSSNHIMKIFGVAYFAPWFRELI